MPSILIVTEIQNGKIREASYELASLAQKISGESGREVKSLVMGKGVDALADEFSKKGGGEVYAADDDLLENNNVEARSIAIHAAIEASGADLILVSNTPSGWDVAHQVANAHTIFNVINTMLFLPFANQLAAIVRRIVPDAPPTDRKSVV